MFYEDDVPVAQPNTPHRNATTFVETGYSLRNCVSIGCASVFSCRVSRSTFAVNTVGAGEVDNALLVDKADESATSVHVLPS